MLSLLARSFPFSKDESTQWVVLAAGVLATLYVIMRPRMKGRKVDPLARQASAGMSLSRQRQLERDIGNLMVEMLDTARQMTAQLDTRATKLELLITQADERLAALRTAGTSAPATPARTPTPPADEPAPESPAPVPPEPAPATLPAAFGSASEPVETPPDPRHAEIYALADGGQSPREIARSLDRPHGEIELILALRRH